MTECNFVRKCIIFAPTISSFGGAALLQALVDAESECDFELEFQLNRQVPLNRFPKSYSFISAGMSNQIFAELKLLKDLTAEDTVIYFTNRPPIRSHNGFCATIILSAFAIETPPDAPTSITRAFKSKLQKIFNIYFGKNTNVFVTRSEHTSSLVEKVTGIPTYYFPFMTDSVTVPRSIKKVNQEIPSATFFYPADSSLHKNHKLLFDAWRKLKANNIGAKLIVTLSVEKANEIDKNYSDYGIEATGYITDEEIIQYYKSSDALIFPSLIESFPLPLIEARKYDLPIIAGERDYIREQVDPEESFDPGSSNSIKMAVLRFMGKMNSEEVRPDALSFMDFVLGLKAELQKKSD